MAFFYKFASIGRFLAKSGEIAEGALIGALEAGFVAIQDAEFVGIGEASKGEFQALQLIDGFLAADAGIEHAGFDGHGAAETPEGAGDIFHHAFFNCILGLEKFAVGIEHEIKQIAGFILDDNAARKKAMAHGSERRAALALRGFGSAREGSIGL